MIEIDGSVLEGGGQILRIALSLSSLLSIPIKIINIRAGRSKPGLAAQHLKGVEILKNICNANVKGAEILSTQIEFIPGHISGGSFTADTKTAGSIALLMQVALPVAFFANSPIMLTLKGGTNAANAPQIDFMTEIFRPNLEKFGATFDFDLLKRGYFPRGGGCCVINIEPVKQLNSVDLTNFGELCKIFGWSFVSGSLEISIAKELENGAKSVFNLRDDQINIEVYKEDAKLTNNANCSGIILGGVTTTNCIFGSSELCSKKMNAFKVGKIAAEQLSTVISNRSCVDDYTQDQMIIFMALANGVSRMRIGPHLTLHTQTAIYIVEKLTNAKFTIKEDGNTNIIECIGIGLKNSCSNI